MSEPATHLASCIVKASSEDAFREWADRLEKQAATCPGFRQTLRLEQAGGLVHLLTIFDDAEALRRWQAHPATLALMRGGRAHAAMREDTAQASAARFALPAEASGAKWRRFLVTWLAVFPILLVLNGLLQLLPVRLPMFARLAISSPLLTATLTWLVLPWANRRTRAWRLSDGSGRPST
ncbi:hypothetical protein [Sphingomonas aracearum]|uniref:Antibiotic biosynthesis monooxygenase n=1 Tax=Sphingomonas aracearum TaxID=2283317 RepID=A0A369VVY5_9SPHN|nr:hypothetical protein [Sphingomonas aracearum]RDE06556.1 hypothetical protein DVW87_02280 [Sphingomonas aracearum]